jgi:hypothetical protein
VFTVSDRWSWTFYPKFVASFLSGKFTRHIKSHPYEITGDMFDRVAVHMMEREGVRQFGIMSFCWGAYLGFKSCCESKVKDFIAANVSCKSGVAPLFF